jgi:membrane associated rhomboid family serine protease
MATRRAGPPREPADTDDHSSLTGPTAQTLGLFAVVFLVSQPFFFLLPRLFTGLFALSTPVTLKPWTLVTSVYAHFGLAHLLANAVALVLFGLLFERMVTPWAYHAFFLVTGAVAGLANVWAAGLLGGNVAVIGGSGAIFGVMGYVLAGNRLSQEVVDSLRLSTGVQLVLGLVVAVAVTLVTASPGVALIAHFTGFVVGLGAGRVDLLPSR